MSGIKTIHMGVNTEPIFALPEKIVQKIESYKGVENGLEKFKEEHKDAYYMLKEHSTALELKKQIEKAIEEDGSCLLSFSCDGRSRHQWQSELWFEKLNKANGGIYSADIDYNYYCKIYLKDDSKGISTDPLL